MPHAPWTASAMVTPSPVVTTLSCTAATAAADRAATAAMSNLAKLAILMGYLLLGESGGELRVDSGGDVLGEHRALRDGLDLCVRQNNRRRGDRRRDPGDAAD